MLTQLVFAQQGNWKFSGQLNINNDFYHLNSDTVGAVKARRPDYLGRVVCSFNLGYKNFSLPVTLMFANAQTSIILPHYPDRDFLNYIKDPSNRIGIAPKYKWIEVLLGTYVPRYSELSSGDLPQFGAGFNLTPGKFCFSAFKGTSQLAIKEDTAKNINGIYARKYTTVKLGLGNEGATHIYFIACLMEDDTTSLLKKPLNTLAQKGILSSIDCKINIGKKLSLNGELAGSAFTRDLQSKELTFVKLPVDFPNSIFKIQEATRVNYASVASINKEGAIFGFRLNGKYIGDGFVPLGYPLMQTDRMDITFDPRLNLFKQRFQLSGSIGKRINNLSGGKLSVATQDIYATNVNINFSKSFSLAAAYSNFGFKNNVSNDTLRIQMISESFNITPLLNIQTKKNVLLMMLSYNKDAFNDYNTISGLLNNNDVQSFLFSFQVTQLKRPFNYRISFNTLQNKLYTGTMQMQSLTAGIGYKFFKNKFNTQYSFTLTQSAFGSQSPSLQQYSSLLLKWRVQKKLEFTLSISSNSYHYGSEKPGISFIENMMRTALSYTF